ncbi:MAG: RNA ligase [Firmicutes bacterium]|nr:RNA ligase [Bacillota bacterium]
MKQLVLLRGVPASGKSTFIKENNLERYTLNADEFRLLANGPHMGQSGITQQSTDLVWKTLYQFLENRMEGGEFVIVDATHAKIEDIKQYDKLTSKYGYRTTVVNFDISLEEAKRRNALRPELNRVPDKTIDKMYNRIKSTDSQIKNMIDSSEFNDKIKWRTEDFNNYEHVNVFGDIHGCYTPLKEFFDKYPESENEMYIFCGDYLDRGRENKEIMDFLLSHYKKPNFIFIEGNHEKWLRHYANDEIDQIKSKEFKLHTMQDIKDFSKKDLRLFCRNLRQCVMYEKDGTTYFVNHGGLDKMPDNLIMVPTIQLIKGIGRYEYDVDEEWSVNEKSIVQIHGHRNLFNRCVYKNAVNLESGVEKGGCLSVLRDLDVIKIQNESQVKIKDFFKSDLVEIKNLGKLKDGSTLCSCNFTRDAFQHKEWNDLTTKARGLFVATSDPSNITPENSRVVLRSYDKFMNINETPETRIENLNQGLTGEIIAYKKENGFLGIMSCVDDQLKFCSKSTDKSDFAGYFKDLFYKSGIDADKLKQYLKDNNCSAVFEVIDQERDPHIIEYDHSKIVLLDVIKNQLEFERLPYQDLQKLSDQIHAEVKQEYARWKNFDEFRKWYDETKTRGTKYIDNLEGIVIESGNFMCKMKFDYYLHLKELRKDMERIKDGKQPREVSYETDWMLQHKDELTNIIDVYKKINEDEKVR